jgi:sortase A
MAQKTPRSASPLTLAWLVFLLAGCAAPAPAPPTPVLPPPLVSVTHAAAPVEILLSPAAPAQVPERTAPAGLSGLAEELFPGRLIQQISIPSIRVYSPVVPVGWRVDFDESYQSGTFEWDSPGPDVGWVITSALPGDDGNTILYGHNNLYTQVFQRLAELTPGANITLQTPEREWSYKVQQVHKLPILGADAEQLAGYQQYLQPGGGPRLTLISCWPPMSNTHRVVVIARPVE